MKKYSTTNRLNLCLFLILMISVTSIHAQFGLKVGGNLSNLQSYGNSEEGESAGFKPGFQGGMFYKAGISEMLSIVVELNYETRGGISKKEYDFELPIGDPISGTGLYQIQEESDFTQTYINLPILALIGNGQLKGYIGANIGYLIAAEGDFKRTVETSVGGSSLSSEETNLEIDWQNYNSFKNIFTTTPAEDGDFFNSLDFGLNLGAMYYVGAGFLVDFRIIQGFADTTNNHYDNSIYPSEDFTFESREDADRNFSVQFGVAYFF